MNAEHSHTASTLGSGRRPMYGPIYKRKCVRCDARIGDGGATGMCASCAQRNAVRVKAKPKPRKCDSCENFTKYPTARYCSDGCRPRKALRKRVKNLTTYGGADKYEKKLALLDAQGGVCAVCGQPGEMVLDHDHVTNHPRGALHSQCNSAFGLLKESPEKILGLLIYAERWDAFRAENPLTPAQQIRKDDLAAEREVINTFRALLPIPKRGPYTLRRSA
jgi:hypothetical protein